MEFTICNCGKWELDKRVNVYSLHYKLSDDYTAKKLFYSLIKLRSHIRMIVRKHNLDEAKVEFIGERYEN